MTPDGAKGAALTRTYASESVAFCRCHHIDFVHSDEGKGACTGLQGGYDPIFGGYVEWACPCQGFTVEAE